MRDVGSNVLAVRAAFWWGVGLEGPSAETSTTCEASKKRLNVGSPEAHSEDAVFVADGSLEVHLMGTVDFDSMQQLQERLVYEMSGRDDGQATLLLCEHPPVISMGREASIQQMRAREEELARLEVPVRWISRGGGAFPHAPGQLAVYLLLPLDRRGLRAAEFRRRLEEAVADACHELKVPAKRDELEPGLWGRGGQLAFFGAAVKSSITQHGLFLNVAPHPSFLELATSNQAGERSISMQAQRLGPVRMAQVREAVVRQIAEHFGYDAMHLYTGHPLLKRTVRKVCLHA